jgi:hypothetical protein
LTGQNLTSKNFSHQMQGPEETASACIANVQREKSHLPDWCFSEIADRIAPCRKHGE